jgi:hypothetical protein
MKIKAHSTVSSRTNQGIKTMIEPIESVSRFLLLAKPLKKIELN